MTLRLTDDERDRRRDHHPRVQRRLYELVMAVAAGRQEVGEIAGALRRLVDAGA